MTEALTLRDPGRARAMLWGRITLATNQYRCDETDLANTSTDQILASVSQVSSRQTARDLITLGTEIRQHTTDSTALDLAPPHQHRNRRLNRSTYLTASSRLAPPRERPLLGGR